MMLLCFCITLSVSYVYVIIFLIFADLFLLAISATRRWIVGVVLYNSKMSTDAIVASQKCGADKELANGDGIAAKATNGVAAAAERTSGVAAATQNGTLSDGNKPHEELQYLQLVR
jgi:hypothetical protein